MGYHRTTYNDICNYLAARRCFNAGHSIHRIARSAKKSPSTIRRRLKITAHMNRNGVTK